MYKLLKYIFIKPIKRHNWLKARISWLSTKIIFNTHNNMYIATAFICVNIIYKSLASDLNWDESTQLIRTNKAIVSDVREYLRNLICENDQNRIEFHACVALCMMTESCIGINVDTSCYLCSYTNLNQNNNFNLVNMFVDTQIFISKSFSKF